MTRQEARQVLKHLREVVSGHAMALREKWDEAQNLILQASFMESLTQGSKTLDLYLTGSYSESEPGTIRSLASFCLGDKQAWVVTLTDETSYLMFRFPTVEDPRSVYLGSRLDSDLRNLATWRKWKSIDDEATQSELFPEPT